MACGSASRPWTACSRGWASREKKTVRATEQSEEARAAFLNEIAGLKLHDLVCFDESGFHTGMSRVYARAPRNQRAFARVPRNTGKNLTLLCAMSSHGSQAELVIEGPVNAMVFEGYVREVLCPTLKSGQTVLMDNLSSHKGAKVRALIEARGCHLVYFPPYSPDFNPIEMLFFKLKALLRKTAARTTETVIEALGFALRAVTPNDLLGWFQHALPLLPL